MNKEPFLTLFYQQGANRSISAAIAVSLRILQRVAVDIDVEQTESADIVAELCTFTSKVVTSQVCLRCRSSFEYWLTHSI